MTAIAVLLRQCRFLVVFFISRCSSLFGRMKTVCVGAPCQLPCLTMPSEASHPDPDYRRGRRQLSPLLTCRNSSGAHHPRVIPQSAPQSEAPGAVRRPYGRARLAWPTPQPFFHRLSSERESKNACRCPQCQAIAQHTSCCCASLGASLAGAATQDLPQSRRAAV